VFVVAGRVVKVALGEFEGLAIAYSCGGGGSVGTTPFEAD